MNKLLLEAKAAEYISYSAENKIEGMAIFEAPLFGYADTNDPLFIECRKPNVVGDCFITPKDWLPEAKSVVSFFLPFTNEVKSGNAKDMKEPSIEWLYARYEGQIFLNHLCKYLAEELKVQGYEALVPSSDPRFKTYSNYNGLQRTSCWSERHVAFICGLGTFGLSKGLITERGVAGRFGSIVTSAPFEPTVRKYTEVYEYCSMCGACVKHCPPKAISIENGKDHNICNVFLDETLEKYKPRYGCGKCQVKVPCQDKIPNK